MKTVFHMNQSMEIQITSLGVSEEAKFKAQETYLREIG